MTGPVVQLFVNPRSGSFGRRRINRLQRAFEAAGATVRVKPSISDRLEADPDADHLCVAGGDGTLRHAVEALHRSNRAIPISIYPAGTVNLFARERGYPRAAEAFVRRVLGADAGVSHHSALVAGLPLLTCASVGPDSHVVDRLSPRLKAWIGRAAYLVAFGRLLMDWPRPALAVEWDGNRLECQAVYIAKGRYFAGPWSFAPRARLTDPLLHVVTLQRASRRDFMRFAWTMLRGRPVEALEGVSTFTCAALRITGDPGVPLQADGDVVARLPATMALRPDPTLFA